MTSILTVTLNPALDVATSTPVLMAAHKLRCGPATRFPGGGGINVARVLHRLGARTRALYLAGGATGDQLAQLLDAEGVPAQRLPVGAETRENFSVTETSTGREYRFVMPGAAILANEWDSCRMALDALQPTPAWLVLSGSLPPGLAPEVLAQLATAAAQRGSRVVIDSSGAALAAAMQTQAVHLVKPSLRELSELCGQALETEAQWRAAAGALVTRAQARMVALSLGARGAMLVTEQGVWQADPLALNVASTTGAGDSFLAALLHALSRQEEPGQALRCAVAAGSGALLHAGTALCSKHDMERLLPLVQVRRV